MTFVPIREHFRGPERLSPAWTLHKGRKQAECSVWSHVLGFELRLEAAGDGPVRPGRGRPHAAPGRVDGYLRCAPRTVRPWGAQPAPLPEHVWINPPLKKSGRQDAPRS